MTADKLFAGLEGATYSDRIAQCPAILDDPSWDGETRARVAYFLAHAYKQLSQLAEAHAVCKRALGWEMSDDRRTMFLALLALCQYGLGLFVPLAPTLSQLEQYSMSTDVEAHSLMLQGRLLLRHRDPQAGPLFERAEAMFSTLEAEQNVAWAQLSMARLAFVLSDYGRALSAARCVTFPPYIPKARLVEAEVGLARQDWGGALNAAMQVESGMLGELDPVDAARARYVRAECAIAKGDYWNGAILAEEARKMAHSTPVLDLELIDSVGSLRSRIAS